MATNPNLMDAIISPAVQSIARQLMDKSFYPSMDAGVNRGSTFSFNHVDEKTDFKRLYQCLQSVLDDIEYDQGVVFPEALELLKELEDQMYE